ncbi:MAG: hypothetical protein KC619_00005 [Myxococcales bacterium]|nr:hypothetical protein [Myxococcales bacterium]
MALPPRPLRLHPEFVRRSWRRVLGSFAPMLAVFAVAALWQGRAAYELAKDEQVWATGEVVPVELHDASVTMIAGIVRHVRLTVRGTWPDAADGEPARFQAVDDYYTFFTDSVHDGPLIARRDLAEGRLALSWSMNDHIGRWAWLVIFGLIFVAFGYVLGTLGWGALKTWRVARAAARSSVEVELEVIHLQHIETNGRPTGVQISYRLPPVIHDTSVGYRERAAEPGPVRVEHFDDVDGAPILVAGGTRVLALQPPGTHEVTIVREGYWPFVV